MISDRPAGRPSQPAVLPAVLLAVLLAASGCSRNAEDLFDPSETGVLVVDATLIVGQDLPVILLSRTVDPLDPFVTSPVSGAVIQVESEFGGIGYSEARRGVFIPPSGVRVRPETEYRLSVRTIEGEFLGARTTTPPEFRISEWLLLEDGGGSVRTRLRTFEEVGDEVWTRPENQLRYGSGIVEARFDRPDVAAFQVGIESLDEGSDFVIDPDFFEEEDFEQLNRKESSPPFSAENGTLRLPWLAVYFEGRYLLRVHAVDRNWYDLIRSSPALGGGGFGFGGNAGDSFDRPIFNVTGGIGLFGSASTDSVGFYVHPADGAAAPWIPESPAAP